MRSKTPSFITEIPLSVTQDQERTLLVRLDTARQMYNACLGEALRRLDLMRNSQGYKDAKALPRMVNDQPNPQRKALFGAARERYEFSEYDLSRYATQIRQSWLGTHLDAHVTQKVCARAFKAVNDYAFGKHGKPRFKGKGQFDSVEGKSNKQSIRWHNNSVVWSGLEFKPSIDLSKANKVLIHGLEAPTKFVRIVRRKFGDHNRFFAQLVCGGLPYRKPENVVSPGVVGLDIGPSIIAVVSEDQAELKTFCDKLARRQKYIRRLQRQMDRSRRATNPDNYNANGTVKKGKKTWVRSVRYQKVRTQLAENSRKQAAHRKSLHGKLANEVLAQGNVIKTEKLSYKAFQKMFGRSVSFRAPGMFVEMLRRKAANAGGVVYEFDPKPTRLSQTCVCGAIEKKPLSQRWHECDCGVSIQRDIFSAWLASHVENGKLNADHVLADWSSAENRLQMALGVYQPTSSKVRPAQELYPQSRSSAFSALCVDKVHVDHERVYS